MLLQRYVSTCILIFSRLDRAYIVQQKDSVLDWAVPGITEKKYKTRKDTIQNDESYKL